MLSIHKPFDYHGSAVEIVDHLLYKALMIKASDIHLESDGVGLRVRFRIDGVLHDQEKISQEIAPQIISRIKVMAHLNIAQKRVPQDGKLQITYQEHPIDCRISTFPTLNGEKIVVRILDRTSNKIELDRLGLTEKDLVLFRSFFSYSNGFILATGPTGSGKTTTLYAALSQLHSPEKNIITLEDPVEYQMAGVTQGQIHPDSGFTFERGIRALLRQDPDIAMIGEIRDKETARIAIEASLTGHLVLSTLHTNNAPSAIIRLMDMGIEPYLLNASITGVVAQRLARKICNNCTIEYEPDAEEKESLRRLKIEVGTLNKGNGCDTCFTTGYKGRIGIFELLALSPSLHSLIVQHPNFDRIYKQACQEGMKTLLEDGICKMKAGFISLAELLRVVC